MKFSVTLEKNVFIIFLFFIKNQKVPHWIFLNASDWLALTFHPYQISLSFQNVWTPLPYRRIILHKVSHLSQFLYFGAFHPDDSTCQALVDQQTKLTVEVDPAVMLVLQAAADQESQYNFFNKQNIFR